MAPSSASTPTSTRATFFVGFIESVRFAGREDADSFVLRRRPVFCALQALFGSRGAGHRRVHQHF